MFKHLLNELKTSALGRMLMRPSNFIRNVSVFFRVSSVLADHVRKILYEEYDISSMKMILTLYFQEFSLHSIKAPLCNSRVNWIYDPAPPPLATPFYIPVIPMSPFPVTDERMRYLPLQRALLLQFLSPPFLPRNVGPGEGG